MNILTLALVTGYGLWDGFTALQKAWPTATWVEDTCVAWTTSHDRMNTIMMCEKKHVFSRLVCTSIWCWQQKASVHMNYVYLFACVCICVCTGKCCVYIFIIRYTHIWMYMHKFNHEIKVLYSYDLLNSLIQHPKHWGLSIHSREWLVSAESQTLTRLFYRVGGTHRSDWLTIRDARTNYREICWFVHVRATTWQVTCICRSDVDRCRCRYIHTFADQRIDQIR